MSSRTRQTLNLHSWLESKGFENLWRNKLVTLVAADPGFQFRRRCTQFIARDFKEFIRISGMTHVRTSLSYPQSNGKLERWHKSLKNECIRPGTPLSLNDARRLVEGYVDHYNNVRLNSATAYITPKDMLAGR